MCYSAQASLVTAGYLLLAGIWSLKKNKLPGLRLFASMPILFAAQQSAEGLLWLGATHAMPLVTTYAPYAYLFFAFFVWPIFIPVSIYFMEPNPKIKPHLLRLAALGAVVSCVLYAYVLRFGATAQPLACHIYYNLNIPDTVRIILTLLYLSVTVIPFLISTIRFMPFFGLLLLGSYFTAYYFYYMHILSVWCFFAALLSAFVCVVVAELNKKK